MYIHFWKCKYILYICYIINNQKTKIMKTTANFENGKVNFSNGTELEMYQVQSIFNNRSIEEVREYLSEDENWDEEMIDALIECVEENN